MSSSSSSSLPSAISRRQQHNDANSICQKNVCVCNHCHSLISNTPIIHDHPSPNPSPLKGFVPALPPMADIVSQCLARLNSPPPRLVKPKNGGLAHGSGGVCKIENS
ncbi:hypothetical protein niasHT_039963 [Heterodera trifolii]|uniref:Uncharacterized protein n=1 Tax=Heterodera trifolii TaxID=157864 RepID=A0ABD2I7U0_9BILA